MLAQTPEDGDENVFAAPEVATVDLRPRMRGVAAGLAVAWLGTMGVFLEDPRFLVAGIALGYGLWRGWRGAWWTGASTAWLMVAVSGVVVISSEPLSWLRYRSLVANGTLLAFAVYLVLPAVRKVFRQEDRSRRS